MDQAPAARFHVPTRTAVPRHPFQPSGPSPWLPPPPRPPWGLRDGDTCTPACSPPIPPARPLTREAVVVEVVVVAALVVALSVASPSPGPATPHDSPATCTAGSSSSSGGNSASTLLLHTDSPPSSSGPGSASRRERSLDRIHWAVQLYMHRWTTDGSFS